MPGAPDPSEVARGLAQAEGYLLYQSELRTARAEAEGFAARLPWLTAAQREEVVRHYAQDRLALSRHVLRRITERGAELREEYGQRYDELRRRVLGAAVACLVSAAALLCCALWWTAGR